MQSEWSLIKKKKAPMMEISGRKKMKNENERKKKRKGRVLIHFINWSEYFSVQDLWFERISIF
jgi:hypothetical protein